MSRSLRNGLFLILTLTPTVAVDVGRTATTSKAIYAKAANEADGMYQESGTTCSADGLECSSDNGHHAPPATRVKTKDTNESY